MSRENPLVGPSTEPAISLDLYCQQLDRLRTQLTYKRPACINRRAVIFHHDNARTHVPLRSQQKLLNIGWEVFSHLVYSPDLEPSRYHLFRSLYNAFAHRTFNDADAVKTALQQFLYSKPEKFYRRDIHLLPDRW